MSPIHFLETPRLRLRPMTLTDAPRLCELIDEQVAQNTVAIPYPYPLEMAQREIWEGLLLMDEGEAFPLGITRASDGVLMGLVSLFRAQENPMQEGFIGYWIGAAYRRQGYTTEAVARVIRYGFEQLHLNSISADYFHYNPVSRRVMENAGMHYIGKVKINKDGVLIDGGLCIITRQMFDAQNSPTD